MNNSSSIEEEEKTVELDSTMMTHQDTSLEEVRNNTPVKPRTNPDESVEIESENPEPRKTRLHGAAAAALFSDSEDEEYDYQSAVSGMLEDSLHDVSFKFENFTVGAKAVPTSTPMPKKFNFKLKTDKEDEAPQASASTLIVEDDEEQSDVEVVEPEAEGNSVNDGVDE